MIRTGPRLGRKKAADPRDQRWRARDHIAYVADPRETGIVHESAVPDRLALAGFKNLTQKAIALNIPQWAADLPVLSRSHKRSKYFPLYQNGWSACVGFTMTELALAGPVMENLGAMQKIAEFLNAPQLPSHDEEVVRSWLNEIAHQWYLKAQTLDEWPGEEPTYEGTSGRAGAKVGQQIGLYGNYYWLTTVPEIVRYIILNGPVAIGVDFFESDMDPKEVSEEGTALLTAEGEWVGGHEMLVDKASVKLGKVGGPQSWGDLTQSPYTRWEMTFADLEYRLSQGGDALAIPEIRIKT